MFLPTIVNFSLRRRIVCLKRTRLIFVRSSSTALSPWRRRRCRDNLRKPLCGVVVQRPSEFPLSSLAGDIEALTTAKLSTIVPYPYVHFLPKEIALPDSTPAMCDINELRKLQQGCDGPMSCRVQRPITNVKHAGLKVTAPEMARRTICASACGFH